MNRTALASSLLVSLVALPVTAQNSGISLNATVDGYVEVPYSTAVVPQSGITVEAWITYDDSTLPTGWRYPTVIRQGISVGGSEDYFLRINADNVGARVLRWKVATANGSSVQVNWSFAAGQLNTWTHVAATYDGAAAVLYVNGVQVGSAVGNGSPIRDINNEVLRIGKGSDVATPIEVWNGSIDEVRLWPFARTQAEIQQTMNYQLDGVPGRVSTWNLDNHLLDTSGGLHATSGGSVTFVNTPSLLTLPGISNLPIGASTPGCLGPLEMSMGSMPTIGNLDFAFTCTRAPANAPTLCAIAFGPSAVPFPIAGVDYWLDLGSSVLVFTQANGLGTARFGVGLPAWIQPGFGLAAQFGFFDPCGPQGVTASNALLAITQ